MKVIFLDIDGVLNVISQGHDNHGALFHPHLVDNLRSVIDSTGAKIVVSSTWRTRGLEKMREMWKDRGLPGDIIGVTPDCSQLLDNGTCEFLDLVERGHEIQDWLKEHPEVINYVIFDDDNDMLESQRKRFVRTSNNINHPDCVDDGYGLTRACAEDAIRILNS